MNEQLIKKLNYNPLGGKCCMTCRNRTTRPEIFAEQGDEREPYCPKIDNIPQDIGYCDEYLE